MMMAQALICHWLGRDWRLTSSKGMDLNPTERWQSERLYRAVIQIFSDVPDTRAAPLSLHSIINLSQAAGKKAGDWFGPHTVAHLLAGAVRKAERGSGGLEQVVYGKISAVWGADILIFCNLYY